MCNMIWILKFTLLGTVYITSRVILQDVLYLLLTVSGYLCGAAFSI